MTVVWARYASERLNTIFDFITRDSVERASKFCENLIDATSQLASHPFSGPILPEDAAYRRLVVHEYRIVYRVADDTVYVLTIVAPGMTYEHAI